MLSLRMCLEVVAIPADPLDLSAQALSDACGLTVTRSAWPLRNAFYFARGKGCSCSLLGDSASPAGATWALDRRVLDGLASAVSLLAEQTRGLTFQALWIGELPSARARVTLGELLDDIRANTIKTNCVYLIGDVAD